MLNIKSLFSKKEAPEELPTFIVPHELKIKPSDRICILTPHANDETVGCFSILNQYGKQCDVILLTDGTQRGNSIKPEDIQHQREAEFEEVMQYFDVHFYQFVRAQDGNLINNYRLFQKLDLSGYDYVFMPHRSDGYPDHAAVSIFFERYRHEHPEVKATAVYYEVWGTMSMPTHYIDISDAVEKKKEAIGIYGSQEKYRYAERILGLNHYRGMHHHLDYVEAFTIGE